LKTVEVSEIVDSARYLGLPLRITLLTICIMLVDGYDLQTMSFVAPELVTRWGISRSALGGAYFAIRPVPPASYFFYVLAAAILVVVASFSSLRTHIGSRKAELASAV
jgi:hypothetical protein